MDALNYSRIKEKLWKQWFRADNVELVGNSKSVKRVMI